MAEPKSKRVSVSFTEREHEALAAIAAHQSIGISSVVARIARGHLVTGQVDLPDQLEEATPAGAPQRRTLPEGEVGEAPAWLPPIEGNYEAWARERASGVEAMLERYPAELSDLDDGWAKDAPVREQLWALSVWRDLLDTGAYDDPRMELAFASAVGDFAVYLRERPRTRLGRPRR